MCGAAPTTAAHAEPAEHFRRNKFLTRSAVNRVSSISRRLARYAVAIACLALGAPEPSAAQEHAPAHRVLRSIPVDVLQREVPLTTGRGTAHEAITTTSARAQAYYDQGLAAIHSYEW